MFYTYIVTNKRNGTLYTGHTDDIGLRTHQHSIGYLSNFAARYGCSKLVWFEEHDTRHNAFVRERQIKKWNRQWKLQLIESINPHWLDINALPVWPVPQDPLFSDMRNTLIKTYALPR